MRASATGRPDGVLRGRRRDYASRSAGSGSGRWPAIGARHSAARPVLNKAEIAVEACGGPRARTGRRYRKRWTIEEVFQILKSGLRVEGRRFDRAEDLRKCLAFDAATACRVFDIARAARETPEAPAVDTVPEDAPAILKRALRSFGVRPKAPPNPTISEFTVELGRLAGFRPSKRQPLPGIQKLWFAWTTFAPMMQLYRDFRTYGMDDEPDESESTVGN